MSTVTLILTIILMVISVALVVVVMLQSKRGEGLSGAITGQGNFYNNTRKNGKDEFLKRTTIATSVILIGVVIALNIIEFI